MGRLSGYANGGGLNSREAAFLRRAASRLFVTDPQESANAVANWLNDEGHRTVRGGLWRGETLLRTLTNPKMAGLDADGKPIEGFGETVLTPAEYSELKQNRLDRTSAAPPREAFEYLLTQGIADCDECGYDVSGSRVNADAGPGYRCLPPTQTRKSCGKVRMNADRLEPAVAEQVLADLLRPGVHEKLLQLQKDAAEEVERLRTHIEGAEDRFAVLKSLRKSMILEAYKAAEKATKDDLKACRTRVRFLEQIAGVPLADVHDIVAWWMSAPRASQRGLVLLAVTKVHIKASGGGRGRDPHGRIRIDWRASLPS
ncbi:recombinase family protein [Streptomyces sp. G-G2]|uniref:recombinase family protein n=1 Tax=Streptomyces sp. G-G2 TaxID=3046201 RepID=UPI0024BB923D|nr:recombinase family protein [Streptomyces sp. G-G2]MDJ0383255.1 recombinase family protein [Streptomyces sp. G-G2]